jgi:hypothetical protein
MRPDQHTLRAPVDSPDIKFANGLGPTRHPTNALAMRAARPIKKKSPAISTAQAMLRTRPITTPVTIGGKQPPRGKWG